jgi:adenosylcobinamide-GDP ribazoletransferase
VSPARSDGLSASAGRPPQNSVLAAALIGVVAMFLGLGVSAGLVALVLALAVIVPALAYLFRLTLTGQLSERFHPIGSAEGEER